jgi:hypothetical protein
VAFFAGLTTGLAFAVSGEAKRCYILFGEHG